MQLPVYDSWELLNEKLINFGGTASSDCTIRSYSGLAPAIWEIAQGTAQFYSHKRSVTLISGRSPYLGPILPFLYKEGFNVQVVSDFGNAKEFVEGLKKDTNFVIFCEDHAVTAETYAVDELDALLNEKKIFSLRVSHSNHLYHHVDVRPYTVRICGYHPQAAIAFVGSKYKAPATIAPLQFWDHDSFIAGVQQIKTSAMSDKDLVHKFESSLPEGYEVLPIRSEKSFDRSLIYNLDIAGEALQNSLASKLKINLEKPGWERNIETTHLCRWGGVSTYRSWWDHCPSEDILRNTLVLSVQIINNPKIISYLQEAQVENRLIIEA